MLKEGVSWRAIDCAEISWNTVYGYFRTWTKLGVLSAVSGMIAWQEAEGEALGSMDSTHVKVHRSGSNPAGGQEEQAIGMSRGGKNTKIHAIVASNGQPLAMMFSTGAAHDNPFAVPLINKMSQGAVTAIIADRAYDANATRAAVAAKQCEACIPPKANRKKPAAHDPEQFKKRHVVENFWEFLKRYRRVATRYDKLLQTFEGFVHLCIIVQNLRGQFKSAQFRRP